MTEADIERFIVEQGCTMNLSCHQRYSSNPISRVFVYSPQAKQQHYLGTMAKLSQLSEADLVALIKSKSAQTAQSAQKGKE